MKRIQKTSTSTLYNSSILESALGTIEKTFKKRIIATFIELKERNNKAQYNGEYDSAGLSAGKFCETLFRFIQHELQGGKYTLFTERIGNLSKELIEFEKLPKATV